MVDSNKKTNPREQQFIRFLDTVRKTGSEPAINELDDTLSKLVPPVRAATAEPGLDEVEKLHQ